MAKTSIPAHLKIEATNDMADKHDLRTFVGWCAAACELLASKPKYTALVMPKNTGYMVICQGDLVSAEELPTAKNWNSLDFTDLDSSAWCEGGHWDCDTLEDSITAILAPVFTETQKV